MSLFEDTAAASGKAKLESTAPTKKRSNSTSLEAESRNTKQPRIGTNKALEKQISSDVDHVGRRESIEEKERRAFFEGTTAMWPPSFKVAGHTFSSAKASESCDFVSRCDKRVFNVHKMILQLRSEFFTEMFRTKWKESITRRVWLQEDPATVARVLGWMYTSRMPIEGRDTTALSCAKIYKLADQWLINDLKELVKKLFLTAKFETIERGLAPCVSLIYNEIIDVEDLKIHLMKAALLYCRGDKEIRTAIRGLMDEVSEFGEDLINFMLDQSAPAIPAARAQLPPLFTALQHAGTMEDNLLNLIRPAAGKGGRGGRGGRR
ncbi:hypothetical protein BT63DRAFT_410769 [Microthyrium microscopicum]|uniref:BTB domain-containing protein n=1 Tax=Microthyrium microscopicum TaxID=703497 RepID=A0A6A6UNK2_9PEZI|nr:hypothetical protein BT63DRAFT_410769 [Microthyrium microscopicum]